MLLWFLPPIFNFPSYWVASFFWSISSSWIALVAQWPRKRHRFALSQRIQRDR